jgi:hypothetical protein
MLSCRVGVEPLDRFEPAERLEAEPGAHGQQVRNWRHEREEAVQGYVSGFTGAASAFRVTGYPVRLAAGVVYGDGVATDLKAGIRVEEKGSIDNGVLVVTKLEFKSRDDDDGDGDDDDDDDDVSGGSREFEFKGTAACVSCGASTGTFTVKGVTVN